MRFLIFFAHLCVVTVVCLVGCGEDDFAADPLASTTDANLDIPALADVEVMPTRDEGDVSRAPERADQAGGSQNQSAGGSESGETSLTLTRETVEIQPYTGPPIYLDEQEQPPPATVVTAKQPVKHDFPDDGGVQIERHVTKYSDDRIVNDGDYREYFPNGQLFVEGNYVEGEQHGEWTYWHDNGQLCRTVTYDHGIPNGSWDVFRPDGTLFEKRGFNNGRRDGEWITFAANGEQKLRVVIYNDGKLNGEWREWYPTGMEKRLYTFKDGLKEGVSTEWDSEGNKRIEANYRTNRLHGTVTQWSPNGQEYSQQYEDGRLISTAIPE